MATHIHNKPHFFLQSSATSHNFTSPSKGGGGSQSVPAQNRTHQSRKLRGDLANVATSFSELKSSISDVNLEMGIGIQVEFVSHPDVNMAVTSLANAPQGIELHNVKTVQTDGKETVIATAYVPEGKLEFYEKKLVAYVEEKKNRNGQANDHQRLIDSIKSISPATFASMWSDDVELLPADKDKAVWWEVWVSTPKKASDTEKQYRSIISDFMKLAARAKLNVSTDTLRFPEHTVIQLQASQTQLEENTSLLCRVSEIRFPQVTAEFFDSMDSLEQSQWTDDALSRLRQPDDSDNLPYICIIDTGVNVQHPLLAPFADLNDQLTITEDQDPTDNHGHGTSMAGLAIWGDLTPVLASADIQLINHKLESVKTLNTNGDNAGKSLGLITSDAITEVELNNIDRSRTFSMSLSSGKGTNRGRPSSWSSALDSLSVDYLGEGLSPRLFTICAGNAQIDSVMDYPEYNYRQEIHDPAQSWNAITVGAYTDKHTLSEPSGYAPLANRGNISPYSTTSLEWDRKNSPIKPEIVFEGGNIGRDEFGCSGLQDLQLLTTYNDFSQRHYQCANATSSATALAARFTAQIQYQYGSFWPETIRALMVHSADWTDQMYSLIGASRTDKSILKTDMAKLIRKVGFGVPNLTKALNSAGNSLSLIVQDEMQPYTKPTGSTAKTKDMHLHDLPWPIEELQKIGEADVELTITLSYFIEPNPTSKNVLSKYSYASHQLRFDVKHHDESDSEFMRRINAAAEGDRPDSHGDGNWALGVTQRHRGSIHKDIWRGSAADLAARGKIAIYPASGWWKTRNSQQRVDSKARYSLVVSLSVPDVDVDIYSEVQQKIANMVAAPILVEV